MQDLTPYFSTLELPPDAQLDEVRAAYVDLVKVWHPDRYQNETDRLRLRAQEKLKLVNEAYSVLRAALTGTPLPIRNHAGNHPGKDAQRTTVSVSLTPMRFGEEYGYVDEEGRLTIKPQFALAFPYSDGLARVAVPHPVYRLVYGYIDREGAFSISPHFVDALDFAEGYAPAVISVQWGFIDRTGRFQIMPIFEKVRGFSEGRAAVRQRGQWGFIGPAGEYLVAPRFDEALDFVQGWGYVRLQDRWGKVNLQGEVFFLPQGELPSR